MSGSSLLMKPLPPPIASHFYTQALSRLSPSSTNAKERLSALLTTPATEFLAALNRGGPPIPALAVIDNDLIRSTPTFSTLQNGSYPLPGLAKLDGVMLGDCAFDGNILSLALAHRKPSIGAAFASHLSTHLTSSETDALLAVYNLNDPTVLADDEKAFIAVLEFINDIGFYLPTVAYATAAKEQGVRSYVYRFNEPNPWDGVWKGKSTHILDIAFLFQNFNGALAPEQVGAARSFGEVVLRFAGGRKGEEPFDVWDGGEGRKKVAWVLEGGKGEVREDRPEGVGRRGEFWDVAEKIGWDRLDEVFGAWMRG